VLLLQMVFAMLTTSHQTLDPHYCAQFPVVNKLLNIPFILHAHINRAENRAVLPLLRKGALQVGASAYRLLKLLSVNVFEPRVYADMQRVATGA
jgi:hypothetical protein